LIGLGEAQRQIGNPEHRQTLLDAAALAQELSDADRLCRAVLANSRGWITASQFGAVDSERVRALEATAEVLADDDPRRAQVLALLAYELHLGREPVRYRALAADAIEKARAAGDPAALAHTLANASAATWATDTLRERQRVSEELAELVQPLDDPRLSFWAALRRMVVGLQAGERSQVESAISTVRALAASVPEPLIAWTRLKLESSWALVQGDLQTSEQWAIEAYEVATASGEADAGPVAFVGQLSRIRYFQGRFGEILEGALQRAGEPDSLAAWHASAALALIENGREDEARELALAADFQGGHLDETWFMAMFVWAEVCSRLRVLDRAEEIDELLTPFSGQFVAGGTIVSGSIDWALGMLAVTLERYEDADGHFAIAAEIEERLGAPLLLAHTHAGWARTLIARGRSEDLERAQRMLEQAEDSVGAEGIAREIAECRTALASASARLTSSDPSVGA
jgi:tetratricopeptide (TPR) repeat protein